MQGGEMNDWLVHLIRSNVREPIQVEGDLYALIACNEKGATRLHAMMAEYSLAQLDGLGDYIFSESRRGMTAAIGALPNGTWRAAMRIDGYDKPIDLVAALTILE